jgi:hypothetical protein
MTQTPETLPCTRWALDGLIVTRDGLRYRINVESDPDHEAPWIEDDGHGPVSDWTNHYKRAGERVLSQDGRSGRKRYYDFQEAVKIARRDGWDAPPYGTGTAKQRAARAAEADFKFLQGWCNDEWEYCGVIVTPLYDEKGTPDEDDDRETDYRFALWGVEDCSGDYLAEVAGELLDDAADAAAKIVAAAEALAAAVAFEPRW